MISARQPVGRNSSLFSNATLSCFGEAELISVDEPCAAKTVLTNRYDKPRCIYGRGMPNMMEAAPVINHTDAELQMLEVLVGCKVRFEPGTY